MSSPAPRRRMMRRRTLFSLAVVGSLLLGCGLAAFETSSQPAYAADVDSSLTLKWVGDESRAKEFQPARDPQSAHYGDFKNVEVKVSQTSELIDQAIRVDISGMPGATGASSLGPRTATNYVQAMQCWGDPSASDFHETCQWGGFLLGGGNRIVELPYHNGYRGRTGQVPFRAVWGDKFTNAADPAAPVGYGRDVFHQLFTFDNTNEVVDARISAGGAGWFNFEVQSTYAAPHLGCGAAEGATGAGERCWLVIVPRGQHSSATDYSPVDRSCSHIKEQSMQVGSPLNPDCDYWGNRIVVPLDFRPTDSTCPAGVAERPVAGTDLATAAVGSWQPALCADGGATYTFAALSDSVARDQLLMGQSRFVLSGRPLTEGTVAEDLVAGLADAEVVYSPIVVAAPVIGFVAREIYVGRIEQLNLTPRLIAKMLTQSYAGTVPGGYYLEFPDYILKPGLVTIITDPEFQAINPDWKMHSGSLSNSSEPGLIVVPTASDANAQLWAWMQADDKARAFLSGEPDNILPGDEKNVGLTINPNYLPKGHPNANSEGLRDTVDSYGKSLLVKDASLPRRQLGLARDDGTPYSLADTALDTFPRADTWEMPLSMGKQITSRFDTTMWNPPRGALKDVAVDISRDTRKMKAEWDPFAPNASGGTGDWGTKPTGYADGSVMMGFTGTSNARLYGLNTARLQLPNQAGVYVAADAATMHSALGGATKTEVEGVITVDPAKVGAGAYPLTQIVWGAMRLDGSSPEERADYAAFIEQVTTKGQIPGTSAGQLPVGYAPLPDELKAQAAVAAKKIRDYVAPGDPAPTPTAPANTTTTPAAPNTPPAPSNTTPNPGGPNVSAGTGPGETGETETNAPEGLAAVLSAVGGTLLLGASGAIAVPGILRRRESLIE